MAKRIRNKNILDFINYDIENFFNDNYCEFYSDETVATIMVVYEKMLRKLEFDIFDKLQFHIFFDKEVLIKENPINVKLLSSSRGLHIANIKKIIAKIMRIYDLDDENKGVWREEEYALVENYTFKRIWTIGEGDSFVSLTCSKDWGTSLNILFINNLIGFTNQYLPKNQND